jgi:hypothetical protein
LDNSEIKSLLQILGERVPPGFQLILIDGGALALLGSPCLTIDIDFVGDDAHLGEFHRFIMQIAQKLKIDVADPYSIALSKLDRGFDTDFEDIIFLIRQNLVSLNELERITRDALPYVREYDFHPDILDHLKELKNRIS